MVRDFVRWFLVGIICGVGILTGVALSQERPEDNFGASYIGFCHRLWPCERSLEPFRGVPVKRLGFLAPPTFGNSCPCYRRFLALPGPKFVRATLANGTCFRERGRVCGKGETFFQESIASADTKLKRRNPGLLRRYRRNAQRLKGILGDHPEVTIRLALCLECPVSDRARRSLLTVAREVFPGGVFVDSVLTQRCLNGTICEKHGLRPRLAAPCIADTDGESFIGANIHDFERRTRACEAALLWDFAFNLLDPSRTTFQPPLERTSRPGKWEFDNLKVLLAP